MRQKQEAWVRNNKAYVATTQTSSLTNLVLMKLYLCHVNLQTNSTVEFISHDTMKEFTVTLQRT